MADHRPLHPVHPLEPYREAFADLSGELGPDLTVEIDDVAQATDLRLDPGGPAGALAADALGAALPDRQDTWTATPDGEVLRLGPDEWLVTSRRARPQAGEAALRALVAGYGGAAVDVSGQRVVLRVRGPLARELLAFGCALDLHPSRFPAGRCAQTLVAQTGVVLVALGHGDDFLLHVRTSFAGHLAAWLLDAALEFRTAVPL